MTRIISSAIVYRASEAYLSNPAKSTAVRLGITDVSLLFADDSEIMNTRIFYKPHGMENEIFLLDLIEKICMAHGWKSIKKRILNRGTYGWAI